VPKKEKKKEMGTSEELDGLFGNELEHLDVVLALE